MNIAEGMGLNEKIPQFSYISSGVINPLDTLCITNVNLLDHLTKEDIFEMFSTKNQSGTKKDFIGGLSRSISEG
jgi:hypothetical protein